MSIDNIGGGSFEGGGGFSFPSLGGAESSRSMFNASPESLSSGGSTRGCNFSGPSDIQSRPEPKDRVASPASAEVGPMPREIEDSSKLSDGAQEEIARGELKGDSRKGEVKDSKESSKELTPAERAKKAEEESKKAKEEAEKLKKEIDDLKAKFDPNAKKGCPGGNCGGQQGGGGQKGGGCGGAGGPEGAGGPKGAGDGQGPVNDNVLQEQARAVINAMQKGQQGGANGQQDDGQVQELKNKLNSTVQRAVQSQFKPQPETRSLVKQATGNDPFPPADKQNQQNQDPNRVKQPDALAKAA